MTGAFRACRFVSPTFSRRLDWQRVRAYRLSQVLYLYRVRTLYRVAFLAAAGIAFLILGHLAGRLVGAAFVLLAVFFLRRWYLRERTRFRAKQMGECPWCRGDISVEATVCPHCNQEVTPLYAPE